MKKLSYTLLLFCLFYFEKSLAQNIGIGNTAPDKSAVLDIESTSKGLLIPRMTTSERVNIFKPAIGLLVFDTKTESFWLFRSDGWVELPTTYDLGGLKSVNGSSTFTQYNINRKRYIWELDETFPIMTSISISNTILNDLCQDDDGCKVTLAMTKWDGTTQEVASKSFQFFMGANNQWRTDESNEATSGTDGNSAIQHAGTLFNMVYFTDASYPFSIGNDNAVGMSLLKWNAFPQSTICRLIIED